MTHHETSGRPVPSPVAAPDTDTDLQKHCDLCGRTSFEPVGRLDRKGRELHTAVCTYCGLVAHAEIPSEAQLNEFYASDYRRQYHQEITPSDRRVMRAWQSGQRILRQLAPLIEDDHSVFEVGAGIGCTVKLFELAGYEASGIEPGGGFQDFSARRLHAKVEDRFLFDLPAEPAHDVVLLVHVIEHFRSPRAALQHIHAMLKPGGRVYVECPNLAAPFARRNKLFHFAHIHNFTPTTLIGLARRCGFELLWRFSTDDDPNLQMLLGRTDSLRQEVDPDGYLQTITALSSCSDLRYHLRWKYIATRTKKLAGYLREYLTAQQYVERLLQVCNEADTHAQVHPTGRHQREARNAA
ncbi:MAG: class I SAM-dependent methyltransferase [Planctomycetes bacterium]|nr:class I SAM-dependent methyltransferase [Planctomycetota bacterium]